MCITDDFRVYLEYWRTHGVLGNGIDNKTLGTCINNVYTFI